MSNSENIETAEYKELLRDRGEDIMRFLIKENGNISATFFSCASLVKKVNSGSINPNIDGIDKIKRKYSTSPELEMTMTRTSKFLSILGSLFNGREIKD